MLCCRLACRADSTTLLCRQLRRAQRSTRQCILSWPAGQTAPCACQAVKQQHQPQPHHHTESCNDARSVWGADAGHACQTASCHARAENSGTCNRWQAVKPCKQHALHVLAGAIMQAHLPLRLLQDTAAPHQHPESSRESVQPASPCMGHACIKLPSTALVPTQCAAALRLDGMTDQNCWHSLALPGVIIKVVQPFEAQKGTVQACMGLCLMLLCHCVPVFHPVIPSQDITRRTGVHVLCALHHAQDNILQTLVQTCLSARQPHGAAYRACSGDSVYGPSDASTLEAQAGRATGYPLVPRRQDTPTALPSKKL